MSYLSSTVLESYDLYSFFKNNLNEQIKELIHSNEPDILYRAFVEEPSLGRDITQNMKNLMPEKQKESVLLALYASHPNNQTWVLLASMNKPETEKNITSRIVSDLNKCIQNEAFYLPSLNLGQSDYRVFYINLTHENDNLTYVLQLSIGKEGFTKFIEKEKNTFISFTFMIFTFSLILGSIFAKSISRPINKLTDSALDLASGKMGIRFHSKRQDDIGTLARSLDTMSLNLNHRFNSMQTMNRIDRAVLSSVSRDELLEEVAGFISKQFNNTTVAVLEHKEEGMVITARVPERKNTIGRLIFYTDLRDDFRNLKETKIIDIKNVQDHFLKDNLLFPSEERKSKGVIIPIFHNERIAATFIITLDQVSEQDQEALEMLSDQVGVALRSKIDMEQRELMSQGTLIALTRSVDAKSRWTAGHTERVAYLSVALAKEVGLDSKEIDLIRNSALLHDIGKLGIPESILDKPGKLTDEEFDLIKSHPEKGDTIIKDIPGMEEIRRGVRHHHERWDGSGYPDKLKAEAIPRIARIITLADVYDAISEDRPYRDGFTPRESYQFLEGQRGLLFDPELLDSFLSLISREESPL